MAEPHDLRTTFAYCPPASRQVQRAYDRQADDRYPRALRILIVIAATGGLWLLLFGLARLVWGF